MARSLSIAAFLASRGSADLPTRLLDYPARPDGVVIWARCTHADQLTAIETLGRKVTVEVDGGTLHIHWRESDNHVMMTGPVELESEGVV